MRRFASLAGATVIYIFCVAVGMAIFMAFGHTNPVLPVTTIITCVILIWWLWPEKAIAQKTHASRGEISALADRIRSAALTDDEEFRCVVALALLILPIEDSDIAAQFGVSRSTITRWKEGATTPRPAMRQAVYEWTLSKAVDVIAARTPSPVLLAAAKIPGPFSAGWEVVCPDECVRTNPYHSRGDADAHAKRVSDPAWFAKRKCLLAPNPGSLELSMPPCPGGNHSVRMIEFACDDRRLS